MGEKHQYYSSLYSIYYIDLQAMTYWRKLPTRNARNFTLWATTWLRLQPQKWVRSNLIETQTLVETRVPPTSLWTSISSHFQTGPIVVIYHWLYYQKECHKLQSQSPSYLTTKPTNIALPHNLQPPHYHTTYNHYTVTKFISIIATCFYTASHTRLQPVLQSDHSNPFSKHVYIIYPKQWNMLIDPQNEQKRLGTSNEC